MLYSRLRNNRILPLAGPRVANVGDGWFVATEKSDYIQAIGLSSAKFQHLGRSPIKICMREPPNDVALTYDLAVARRET